MSNWDDRKDPVAKLFPPKATDDLIEPIRIDIDAF